MAYLPSKTKELLMFFLSVFFLNIPLTSLKLICPLQELTIV